MTQVTNTWLNEYYTLSMWKASDTYFVRLEWPELHNGETVIARRTLYKGKDEQLANTTFAAEAAEWEV